MFRTHLISECVNNVMVIGEAKNELVDGVQIPVEAVRFISHK